MSNDNAAPDISISVGGAQTLTFSLGTPAAPAFTFSGDTDTGWYRDGDKIQFVAGGHLYTAQDVYSLYHQGKTMKDNTGDYMEVITWLPWVNGDQLKAIETFEFFRRQLFPDDK